MSHMGGGKRRTKQILVGVYLFSSEARCQREEEERRALKWVAGESRWQKIGKGHSCTKHPDASLSS